MIYLAPLQGFTDFVYRKAYAEVFSSIDAFFIPYITVQHQNLLKKYEREILPENNPSNAVPQILVKNAEEAYFLVSVIREQGYDEVNLNLGCPYPMVTKRGRGAGLLPHPEKVEEILTALCSEPDFSVSVKLRAGLELPLELESVVPVLNEFPLKEVILHPRIARQLYKGELILSAFEFAAKELQHPLIFNGDICSVADFENSKNQFPGVQSWMIGRGVLMNVFLPDGIKGKFYSEEEKRRLLNEFHRIVLEGNLERSDNPGNALTKMQQFWTYFSFHFMEQKKTFKRIKKARGFEVMKAEAQSLLNFAELAETR